jgi:ABC-2 type transport system ATP-binding protein
MRCELMLALLHDPVLLFADEPTVGLDVVAKLRIREFLARINEDLGTTIVLTSHDMDDVEALCDRVAVIDGGTVIFDGALGDLRARLRPAKEVSFTYAHPVVVPSVPGIRDLSSDDPRVVRLEVNRVDVASVLGRANTWGELLDVRIADADLDSVMTELFTARSIS